MQHYFINDPNLKSNIRQIHFKLLGQQFSFYTDDGIFSKDKLDFGTKTLLTTVHKEKLFGSCLDLGCGNGVIGIVLATFFPIVNFDLIDVNERALTLAQKNIEHYNFQERLKVGNESELATKASFYDFIFLNPPIRAGKKVIYGLYENAYQNLKKDGVFYVVIRKSHGAMSSKDKINEIFANCEIMKRNKGFYVLKAIK